MSLKRKFKKKDGNLQWKIWGCSWRMEFLKFHYIIERSLAMQENGAHFLLVFFQIAHAKTSRIFGLQN